MKPRKLITAGLLLFVAASVAVLIVKEARRGREEPGTHPGEPAPPHKVVAYYFYGNVRCDTCRKIEAYSHEAIQQGFAKALEDQRLEWRAVNTDEPQNEHFVKDYELYTRSLVLVDLRDGKQARWTNLEKVWDLLEDKAAFVKYVEDEVRAFLGEGG